MRILLMVLGLVGVLAGCAHGELGDVDHSCHANPIQSQGSGCEHHQLP
jgi:hypothetical protein